MSSSQVEIVNFALTRLGSTKFISTMEDKTEEARLGKLWWHQVRRAVLADHWWGFATRRALLASTSELPPKPWGYRYALPEDCVTARFVDDGHIIYSVRSRVPYALIDKGDGNAVHLVTDLIDATLCYTGDLTTTAIFPAKFVEAMSWKLAAEMAPGLTVSGALMDQANRYYIKVIAEARADSDKQEQARPEPEPDFTRLR